MLKKRLHKSLYTAEWEVLLKTLKDLREKNGWTQSHLAKKLGRHQSLVAKIELGERKLDVCQFIDYVQILEADPVAVLKQILKDIQKI